MAEDGGSGSGNVMDGVALAPLDLYERLARRLPEASQRELLRALLERLAEGGSDAVREEVRRRLQDLLRDAS